MSKLIDIDQSSYPTIYFRSNPIEATLENYKAFIKESEELLNGDNSNMLYIMDLTKAKAYPVEVRIEQGNWSKRAAPKMKEKVRGIVFINKSVVMNIMMKCIFLIQKPVVPYVIVKDIEEARSWIDDKTISKAA